MPAMMLERCFAKWVMFAINCIGVVAFATTLTGRLWGATITTDPPFTVSDLQTAVTDVANAGGGSITLSSGTFNLSSTVSFPAGKGHIKITGAGIGATILTYSGSSDALAIGSSAGTLTPNITIEDLTLDLSGAIPMCGSTSTTVGIHAIETFGLVLSSVMVKTIQGCTVLSGQTAISLDGTGNFAAYSQFFNTEISGDFTTGILIKGGTGSQAANATTMVGGYIVNTTASRVAGSKGVHIVHGDTTRMLGTDLEGWDIAVDVASNTNGPLGIRAEGNNTDWKVEAGTDSVSFVGASFTTFSDAGTHTSYATANPVIAQTKAPNGFIVGAGSNAGCKVSTGSGSPNSVVSGNPCDLYVNTSGGTGTTLYVKESGVGTTTGWVAK